MKENPRPTSIFWFVSGVVAVCDQYGKQMPEYQGNHREVLQALKRDGWDWTTFTEVYGCPDLRALWLEYSKN